VNIRQVVTVLRNTAEYMQTLDDPADIVDSGNVQAKQLDQLVGLAQAMTGTVSDEIILLVPRSLEVGDYVDLDQEGREFQVRRDS